jgi:hypothetical protein
MGHMGLSLMGRPQDPGEDDAVETEPRRGLDGDRGVDEDVVVEGVAVKGEKH